MCRNGIDGRRGAIEKKPVDDIGTAKEKKAADWRKRFLEMISKGLAVYSNQQKWWVGGNAMEWQRSDRKVIAEEMNRRVQDE